MRHNEQPTRYFYYKPTYHDMNKIPPYLASRAQWERRGLAVNKGSEPMGHVNTWDGRQYKRFDLYHMLQCRLISGIKAERRRSISLSSAGQGKGNRT